ncbi:calcium-independent phospholipase A2-gamma-like isoform X2 [Antennarius striatus]|uniref:calcium-independent phospholipase A2-gamma-like isoform X2 n=1 Tax=Antennarius striatus TaxID=241820 RepID=UPI0035B403F3
MGRRMSSVIWMNISRAFHLWQTRVPNSVASLPVFGTSDYRVQLQHPFCSKAGGLHWRHNPQLRITGRKRWKTHPFRHRLGLHTSTLHLYTPVSRWSAGLSQHMSRFRTTLDTMTKAMSGTHEELFTKIARFKPKASKAGKKADASVESVNKTEESVCTPTSGPMNAAAHATPIVPQTICDSCSSPATPLPTSAAIFNASDTTSNHPHKSSQAAVSATAPAAQNLKEKRRNRLIVKANGARKQEEVKPPLADKDDTITTSKPTELFHVSTFSVNLDETYNYLSNHINSYFGASTKTQSKKEENDNHSSQSQKPIDLVPVSERTDSDAPDAVIPPSSKKGLGHYFSYSAPNVQAFVGTYIAPLVPKFKTAESKRAALEEKMAVNAPVRHAEATVSTEQKAAEEKAKKLFLQREKIIARVSVDNRTRALVQGLHRASDVRVYINRVEDLSYHLLEFPETCGVAVKEKVIPCLLRLKQANDPGLRAAVREALALVGYHAPVKGRGIRILSIDGGGLRGLLALQTLHKLEALTGKPIYKLFDYICGVSTGAILGFMLGVFQIPLNECADLYRKLGSDVFKQNVIVGTVKMGWSHAFYNSESWENILKEKMGSQLLVETSRNPECPKVAAVSTIVNRGTPLKAYVFRNYNLLPGVRSHYLGGSQHQLWQAIRATSAAPGYFQEFTLGNDLHQDGGLLINNPTALAVHECNCLWPNTPLDCVVSLGTGRIETLGKNGTTYTSLKTKLNNVISSATDTEDSKTMTGRYFQSV